MATEKLRALFRRKRDRDFPPQSATRPSQNQAPILRLPDEVLEYIIYFRFYQEHFCGCGRFVGLWAFNQTCVRLYRLTKPLFYQDVCFRLEDGKQLAPPERHVKRLIRTFDRNSSLCENVQSFNAGFIIISNPWSKDFHNVVNLLSRLPNLLCLELTIGSPETEKFTTLLGALLKANRSIKHLALRCHKPKRLATLDDLLDLPFDSLTSLTLDGVKCGLAFQGQPRYSFPTIKSLSMARQGFPFLSHFFPITGPLEHLSLELGLDLYDVNVNYLFGNFLAVHRSTLKSIVLKGVLPDTFLINLDLTGYANLETLHFIHEGGYLSNGNEDLSGAPKLHTLILDLSAIQQPHDRITVLDIETIRHLARNAVARGWSLKNIEVRFSNSAVSRNQNDAKEDLLWAKLAQLAEEFRRHGLKLIYTPRVLELAD